MSDHTSTTESAGAGRVQLPFLPGMTFQDPARTKFHKSHAFDYRAGRRDLDQTKPGIGGSALNAEQEAAARTKVRTTADILLGPSSASQRSADGYVPSWAGQVLRFEGHYKEEVQYAAAGYRVRRCALAFHLEDDSLEVMALDHATGKPMGTLVRRHRVPADGGDGQQHITAAELNVGRDVVIYSRAYRLYNCDLFTQMFLEKLGVQVPPAEELPEDPAATPRGTAPPVKPTLVPTRPAPAPRGTPPLAQFLANDRNVLRYYCVWDDRDSPFGDLHKFRLHYFLADDTMELLEEIRETTSLDVPTTFVKRGAPPEGFPALRDIGIGTTISLYNRNFLVYDLDAKTKNHYRETYGVQDFTPLRVDEPPAPPPKREIPPHTGFGSEEDSYQSCLSLVPKPPRVDWQKRMEDQGKALVFEARFDNATPADRDRTFTIQFNLADDTIGVFEAPRRDIAGGKFFEKARVKHHEGGRYYAASDLYVGARVTINGYKYAITNAAEWAYRFMEAHLESWPESDFDAVVAKLSRSRAALAAALERGAEQARASSSAAGAKPARGSAGAVGPARALAPGYVEQTVVRRAFEEAGVTLTQQEFATVMRRFDLDENGSVHVPSFVSQLRNDRSAPSTPKKQ
eukprot:m51a1_g4683 hypothetical protein (629) ;mRNA; r:169508-171846